MACFRISRNPGEDERDLTPSRSGWSILSRLEAGDVDRLREAARRVLKGPAEFK